MKISSPFIVKRESKAMEEESNYYCINDSTLKRKWDIHTQLLTYYTLRTYNLRTMHTGFLSLVYHTLRVCICKYMSLMVHRTRMISMFHNSTLNQITIQFQRKK